MPGLPVPGISRDPLVKSPLATEHCPPPPPRPPLLLSLGGDVAQGLPTLPSSCLNLPTVERKSASLDPAETKGSLLCISLCNPLFCRVPVPGATLSLLLLSFLSPWPCAQIWGAGLEIHLALQSWEASQNPPASARDIRDAGSRSESGRSPGVGNDNPLQYSCLENNPTDRRRAWRAIIYSLAKSRTPLSTHTHSAPQRWTQSEISRDT